MYKRQTEDDLKETEKDIQDLTDKYIKEIDNISAAKEKEIGKVVDWSKVDKEDYLLAMERSPCLLYTSRCV